MILDDLLTVLDAPTKDEKAALIDQFIANGCGNIIKMIFNDLVKFNVAVVRLPDMRLYNKELGEPSNEDIEGLLEKLASRKLTGNHALAACTNLGNRLNEEQFSMFCDILESNPRVGIGTTDLNKRCELFKVPQFKVHLCKSLKDVKDKIDYTKEWIIQSKIDGNRIIGIKDPFTKLYSRKGHTRESLNHILEVLNKFPTHCVFDGEVEYKDSLEATGAIRRKKEQAKEAIYTMFGIYDIKQWKSELHTDEYQDCYEKALHFMKQLPEEDKRFVRIVPSIYLGKFTNVNDLLTEAEKHYQEFLEMGYEGAVMKTITHSYLPSSGSKRSMETIKIKPWIDGDTTVIDFNESDKVPDSLGSFKTIDAKGREFDVSPGNLTKEECEHIWTHPHLYVDKTLEFKFQGYSLYDIPRHATATKFRDDI